MNLLKNLVRRTRANPKIPVALALLGLVVAGFVALHASAARHDDDRIGGVDLRLVLARLETRTAAVAGDGRPPASEMIPGRSVTFRISRITDGFMRSARRAMCQRVAFGLEAVIARLTDSEVEVWER